jgi:hypothetical protein
MVGGVQGVRRGYHAKVIDHYENPRNVGITITVCWNVVCWRWGCMGVGSAGRDEGGSEGDAGGGEDDDRLLGDVWKMSRRLFCVRQSSGFANGDIGASSTQ